MDVPLLALMKSSNVKPNMLVPILANPSTPSNLMYSLKPSGFKLNLKKSGNVFGWDSFYHISIDFVAYCIFLRGPTFLFPYNSWNPYWVYRFPRSKCAGNPWSFMIFFVLSMLKNSPWLQLKDIHFWKFFHIHPEVHIAFWLISSEKFSVSTKALSSFRLNIFLQGDPVHFRQAQVYKRRRKGPCIYRSYCFCRLTSTNFSFVPGGRSYLLSQKNSNRSFQILRLYLFLPQL